MSSYLSVVGLTKRFGEARACDSVDLSVQEGELLVLLGPSGCGKSTTLRMLAGFETPDAGEITLNGRTLVASNTFVPPERRGIGIVFQSYALWPHMRIIDQVAFGLTKRKQARGAALEEALHALELVELGDLAQRYPHELSGGQQQRVALARALAIRPPLLLLDEPLSNLDARLREEMKFTLKSLQHQLGQTMIYVTHDQSEALSMGDQIVVMRQGRIEQSGPPEELYSRPRTAFAARALGPSNILPVDLVSEDETSLQVSVGPGGEAFAVPKNADTPDGTSQLVLSIRPSDLKLSARDTPGTNVHLCGTVKERFFQGNHHDYQIVLDPSGDEIRVQDFGTGRYEVGTAVDITIATERVAVVHGDVGRDGTTTVSEHREDIRKK